MPVFPLGPPVTVVVDGRRVPHYARAFVARGRVYVTTGLAGSLADRAWISGGTLWLQRDGRTARVTLPAGWVAGWNATFVAIAPLLRGLGDRVRFQRGVLEVRTPVVPLETPTPFLAPRVAPVPRQVFTPEPVPTPRPVWTGSPLPRRTPLPFPPGC